MKFGVRKPSFKKSFKARTTGKIKRKVKKNLIPGYGKKGVGWIKNPQKAAYNKIYNKTSVSVFPSSSSILKSTKKKNDNKASSHADQVQRQVYYDLYPNEERKIKSMKICKYCGTENVDSASLCSSCGANEFKNKCGNCGTAFDEGMYCPKCGVKAGAQAKICPNCGAEYYSVACPDCGYINNAGNTTAAYPNTIVQPVKKRKTWLWVLGWICIFPIPLTILMVRNQKLNKGVKIAIIAAAWIIYLLIGITGNAADDNNTENNAENAIESSQVETTTKESAIESLVNDYNAVSDNKLVFVEDFAVSSKDSGHYRTEFRLAAYSDAVGKSYKLEDQIVDIISTQSHSGEINVRIYTDGANLDQCKALVQNASQLLDPTMTDATVKETIDYISENKEANGYYYGELGLLLLGSDVKGYDLMIKTD